MQPLPPISNPLRPRVRRSWMAPIRFRAKPYLELSESISRALAELEARYPSHRATMVERRQIQNRPRKPR